MHFPTSLPPTSGSPAAKLVFERGSSPHPKSFDGPLPPPSTPGLSETKIPLRRRSTAPNLVRIGRPRFPPPVYAPPIPSRPTTRVVRMPGLSSSDISLDSRSMASSRMPASLTTAKLKMDGRGLPSERLIEARNSWKRKRKARLDGARKPDLVGSVGNLDGPFHTEFETAKEDAERSLSLMSMSSQRLKRLFHLGQDPEALEQLGLVERNQDMLLTGSQQTPLDELERSHSSGTRNESRFSGRTQRKMTLTGPRERFSAARASREEEKEDFDTTDSGVRGHRMSEQMKKLRLSEIKERHGSHHRRKNSEKEAKHFQVQVVPEKHQEHLRFAELARRKIHTAREEIEALKTSIIDDIHDSKESGPKRIVNAVRTAKTHLENMGAERQMGVRMASVSGGPGERAGYLLSTPNGPAFASPSYDDSTSSSSDSLLDAQNLQVNNDSPPSPNSLEHRPVYNPPTPRNRAYQQVFAARPSLTYRPTLSPVYSRSPIPTNSLSQLASTSPKSANTPESDPVSIPTNLVDEVIPARSPPKLFSRPFPRTETRPQGPARGLSPPSVSTIKKERIPQSANETTNFRKKSSYESSRGSLVIENDIPPLKLPSPIANPVNPKSLPGRFTTTKNSSRQTPEVSGPQNTKIYFPTLPKAIEVSGIGKPDHELLKTPTTSALEFWAAADASLAPSESASAQRPNRIDYPPPDIWKDADRTSNLRNDRLTLEEWVASLPGLGLRHGTNSELDAQMLKELRSRSITGFSSEKGKDAIIEVLAEKLEELENQAIESAEELVPEDEAGLTVEEIKALEESEPIPQNAPPPVVDHSLLHPDYRPSPSPSMILQAISPIRKPKAVKVPASGRVRSNSTPRAPAEESHILPDSPPPRKSRRSRDLAEDATIRLETLQKYWDDQGVIVGTVLRRMLWIVDTMIVKEREEAQRLARKHEMGWADDDGDGDIEDDGD